MLLNSSQSNDFRADMKTEINEINRVILLKLCRTISVLIWPIYFTFLWIVFPVNSQPITKKILVKSEEKFEAPISIASGMPFSITYNKYNITSIVRI